MMQTEWFILLIARAINVQGNSSLNCGVAMTFWKYVLIKTTT